MKCNNCGSNDVIPIVYGSTDAKLWRATLRGMVHLGGSVRSEGVPRWYCTNCEDEASDSSSEEYVRQVTSLLHDQESVAVDPVIESMSVMMGRRVAQRIMYEFGKIGATKIRILDSGDGVKLSAYIDNEWSEFDWPICKYLKEMIEAHHADQLRDYVVVDNVVLRVECTEIVEDTTGLMLQIFSPNSSTSGSENFLNGKSKSR